MTRKDIRKGKNYKKLDRLLKPRGDPDRERFEAAYEELHKRFRDFEAWPARPRLTPGNE